MTSYDRRETSLLDGLIYGYIYICIPYGTKYQNPFFHDYSYGDIKLLYMLTCILLVDIRSIIAPILRAKLYM